MRIGRTGSTDRIIFRNDDGFYLSLRFAGLRLRIALGGGYVPTLKLCRSPEH